MMNALLIKVSTVRHGLNIDKVIGSGSFVTMYTLKGQGSAKDLLVCQHTRARKKASRLLLVQGTTPTMALYPLVKEPMPLQRGEISLSLN